MTCSGNRRPIYSFEPPTALGVPPGPAPGPRPSTGVLGLVAAVVGLYLLGRGRLAAPPLGSMAAFDAWLELRGPVAAALAIVRLLAIVVAGHLVIVTIIGAVGQVSGRPGLVNMARRATIPAFRGLLGGVVGLGIGALSVATSPSTAGATPATSVEPVGAQSSVESPMRSTVTLAKIQGADPDRTAWGERSGSPAEATSTGRSQATLVLMDPANQTTTPLGATLTRLGGTDGDGVGADTATDTDLSVAAVTEAAPIDAGPTSAQSRPGAGRTHPVVVGDHLWALAEAEIAAASPGPGEHASVEDYWQQVVLANPQLGDPDLLFVGEQVSLPPIR